MKSSFGKPPYRSSRRSALKGTLVGIGGLAAAGGVIGAGVFFTEQQQTGARAAGYDRSYHNDKKQTILNILNIAATAEALAVVFYSEVLEYADRLGLKQTSRADLKAALIEEQIHLLFLELQGAKPLTKTFSFPYGYDTFEKFDLFLKTQQLLESAFVAAYLAAVKQFAQLGRPDLAQVAGQIATIEAEHRVAGRLIGAMLPINNEAFSPLLFNTVADAATALKNAGFLSPKYGNSFSYSSVSTSYNGVSMRSPDAKS